jgi:hypothetical protein
MMLLWKTDKENYTAEASSKPFSRYRSQFALCESCFWCTTILYCSIKKRQDSEATTNADNITQTCPMCNKDTVALLPLQEDEGYQISLGDKRWLEMQFPLSKTR